MTEKESIFLTGEEARKAVVLDFERYEPQMLLFGEILRVISDGRAVVKRVQQKGGVWVRAQHHSRMDWLDEASLGAYVSRALDDYDPGLATLASVCSRVFQTRAFRAVDPETGSEGIRVETGMEEFNCRQCGNCCKSLNYHDAVEPEDVARWEKAGRNDILERVGIFRKRSGETRYRIWVRPGTRDLADTCPFLHYLSEKNRWVCQIHDLKPSICRNYPVSRKHGRMTGCPGFLK